MALQPCLPILLANASLTSTAGSEARGASSGRMYSGKTLASLAGKSFTQSREFVTQRMAAARTRASGACVRYIWKISGSYDQIDDNNFVSKVKEVK